MPHLTLETIGFKLMYKKLICRGLALNTKFRGVLAVLLTAYLYIIAKHKQTPRHASFKAVHEYWAK